MKENKRYFRNKKQPTKQPHTRNTTPSPAPQLTADEWDVVFQKFICNPFNMNY